MIFPIVQKKILNKRIWVPPKVIKIKTGWWETISETGDKKRKQIWIKKINVLSLDQHQDLPGFPISVVLSPSYVGHTVLLRPSRALGPSGGACGCRDCWSSPGSVGPGRAWGLCQQAYWSPLIKAQSLQPGPLQGKGHSLLLLLLLLDS
jgi:hypothetical protein